MKRRPWYIVRGLLAGLVLGALIVPAMYAASPMRTFEDCLSVIVRFYVFAGVGLLIGFIVDLSSALAENKFQMTPTTPAPHLLAKPGTFL